ncbi:2Fe-2S iron-sulfur cluster binding domain containing protein [Nitzschia inconspicua]|uniref:2Fe-2S iron-sulfur cluster binding domain containing protein n=1 Tax=Nitzschia inconspicua TaxID=303405 RepID=A0A9K3KLG5_9STRA|nr:2Fe-2S iron-sulfur cluster binding domain containing protein [Nitzschia inconspicua]
MIQVHTLALPIFVAFLFVSTTLAFTSSPLFGNIATCSSTVCQVVAGKNTGKGYSPKWTKKETLADKQGSTASLGFENVGLKGTIPVVFRQGNETRTSMAWAGQPLRDVATQAGQFIQYGCGKGECGTCECMMNGKWVRPCIENVPAAAAGAGDLVIQVKAVKAKSKSSGTFFSIRSFLMGFWNNLLGMIGFVKFRKAARKNWEERKAYEDLVLKRTMEKKLARAREEAAKNGGTNPSPRMA